MRGCVNWWQMLLILNISILLTLGLFIAFESMLNMVTR